MRRNLESGDVEADEATVALKYHGFRGELEYDVLVAEHYGDTVLGLGGGRSIGGAIWRGDIVASHTDNDTTLQLVTNLSYSWIWRGKNMSGAIEYFYNGFGQSSDSYDLPSVIGDPDLFVTVDLPDNVSAASFSLLVTAAGGATVKTVVLMTPEEVDQATKKTLNYRPPGQ